MDNGALSNDRDDRGNLSKLDSDYQILTELHRSADTRVYLARHLALNRDVTITVVTASGKSDDTSYLAAFAKDAEVLKNQRHPSVVQVIEARQLDDQTLAIVRARVRGSTLDQLVSAVGAMPQARMEAALRDVAAALAWARVNGITNRNVSPESVVFQQGPGRLLLSFEPSRVVSDDDRTLRELGAAMNGGTPVNVAHYATDPAPKAAIPPRTTPAGRNEPAVVVQKQGMGFGARVLMTFIVIGALIGSGVYFMHWRGNDIRRDASTVTPDTQSDAAGDVALRSSRAQDAQQSYPTPVIIEPTPTPTPTPTPMPAPPPVTPQQVVPLTVPQPAPRPVQPPPRPAPVDTVVTPRPATGDACDSPEPSDQRKCLSGAVEKADREMNDAYAKLIVALRRQANVADTDPDPSSVDEVRASQRRWLQDRDDVCRGTGAGLLYARDRAACFSERAAARTRDLQQQLSAIP